MIIKIEAEASGQHLYQSQSHRQECWLDGYVAVPAHLENAVIACSGYCDIEMSNSILKNIIPRPELIPVEPEREMETKPSEVEQLRAEIEQLRAELATIKGVVE